MREGGSPFFLVPPVFFVRPEVFQARNCGGENVECSHWEVDRFQTVTLGSLSPFLC